MAEIGLIASVIQVAGAGLKLSQTLYQYADTVSSADRRVKDIAKDVRLTSIVIQELGHVFKTDESAALLSKSALQTADETVRECEAVFSDLDATLKKSTKSSFGKWKYPFRESKIELLRAHIEKLKSTLQLLMQVLTHAHQVASQKLDREAEAAQREQIKALLQHKKDSAERYEASLKNYKLNADDISDEEDSTDALVGAFSATSFPSINTIATSGASMKSTMTVQTLATCVRHVRSLLEDIEALQQELKNDAGSIDPSDHHQTLVGAYFRARKHLDSLLLGNPEKSVESSTDSGTQSLHKTLTGSTLQAGTSQESVIAKPPSRPRPRARLGEAGARDEIMALEHRKERQEAEVRIAEIHVERKLASTSEALTIAAEQWQQSERYATKARSTRLEVTSMAPGAQSTQSKYGAVLSKYDKEAQLQTEKAKVMEERAVEEEKKLLDARKRLQEAKGELAKITLEYERVAARLNPGQRENDRNVLSRDLLWEREAERRKIVLETQRKSSGQSARSAEAERAAAELALESLRAEEDDAIRRMETGVKKEWGRAEKQTSRGAKWDEAHRQRADEELRMKREYELTTTMEERRKHELRRMKAEAEMERNRADEWASESRKTLGQNQLRRMKAEVERMKRTEVEELELDREEKKHYPYAEGHHETGTHFDEPRRFSRPRGGDANEIEIVEAELSQSPPRPPAFIPSKRARHYRRDAIARQLWGIEVELDFCRKMLEYGQQKSISNQAVFLAMKQREVELTERSSLLSELRERKIREAKLKKDQKQGPSSSTPWSAEKDRKMTTPGCLTCRMRRITCGQEEPHCKNCTSTGRKCEGYGHRVVFAWEKSAPIPSVYNTPLSNSHPPRLAPSYFSPAQRSHLILDAEIVPRYSNTLPSYRRDREDRRLLPPPSSRSYKDHSESPFLRASPYSPAPKEPHCADLRPRSRESARDQERRTRREDRHEDRARAARSSERTLEYDTRIHRREQRKPLSDFLLEAQLETDSDDDASLNRPRTTIPRSGGEKSYLEYLYQKRPKSLISPEPTKRSDAVDKGSPETGPAEAGHAKPHEYQLKRGAARNFPTLPPEAWRPSTLPAPKELYDPSNDNRGSPTSTTPLRRDTVEVLSRAFDISNSEPTPASTWEIDEDKERNCLWCRLRKHPCDGGRPSCGECIAQGWTERCYYEGPKQSGKSTLRLEEVKGDNKDDDEGKIIDKDEEVKEAEEDVYVEADAEDREEGNEKEEEIYVEADAEDKEKGTNISEEMEDSDSSAQDTGYTSSRQIAGTPPASSDMWRGRHADDWLFRGSVTMGDLEDLAFYRDSGGPGSNVGARPRKGSTPREEQKADGIVDEVDELLMEWTNVYDLGKVRTLP